MTLKSDLLAIVGSWRLENGRWGWRTEYKGKDWLLKQKDPLPPKEYNRKLTPAGQKQKDINSSLDLGQMPSMNIKDCASQQPPPPPATSPTCCSPVPLPTPGQLQSGVKVGAQV